MSLPLSLPESGSSVHEPLGIAFPLSPLIGRYSLGLDIDYVVLLVKNVPPVRDYLMSPAMNPRYFEMTVNKLPPPPYCKFSRELR